MSRQLFEGTYARRHLHQRTDATAAGAGRLGLTRSLELRAAPGSWANRAVEASSAYTAERPYTVPDDWDADGWAIDVSYADLAQPIGRDEISFEWRRDHAEAPFDRHGKVKQGYLFPVSDGLAAVVFQDFADRWPPIPPPAADSALPDAH